MLFRLIVAGRYYAFRWGILKSVRIKVPVIVIGNITAGGSGKTPLVIYIVKCLQQKGFKPGIISRGYKGEASVWPQDVNADSDPRMVGDEPVLLARHGQCPVVVGPDRIVTANRLIESGCNVIVSDDGLQHYRLQRDIEIVVIDCQTGFGNACLLPAGPLREPVSRLQNVDIVINHGACQQTVAVPQFNMRLHPCELLPAGQRRTDGTEKKTLKSFAGKRVNAVAGIGNPARFFDMLRSYDIEPVPYPFADHHRFVAPDFEFDERLPCIMTEKDAVKCTQLDLLDSWYVRVEAGIFNHQDGLDEYSRFTSLLINKLKSL